MILAASAAGVFYVIRRGPGDDRSPPSQAKLQQLERRAWEALTANEARKAEALARTVLAHNPGSKPALLCAGQAAVRLKRYDDAVRYFLRFPDDGSEGSKTAFCLAANELLYRNGQVTKAEELLNRVLRRDSRHPLANELLSRIFLLLGRRRKATPHLLRAIAGGRVTLKNVTRLGWVDARFEDRTLLEKCRASEPQNPFVLFGLARLAELESKDALALQLTRSALLRAGDDVELQAFCGRLLLQQDSGQFPAWHAKLPVAAEDSADIWFVRGMWFKGQRKYEAAARCFWECARRLPDHRGGTYQLGLLLTELRRPTEAKPFQARAVLLERLGLAYAKIDARPDDTQVARFAAGIAEKLGRVFEAHGLYEIALRADPSLRTAREGMKRLAGRLKTAEQARTQPGDNPALRVDLSYLPLPKSITASRSRRQLVDSKAVANVRFRDVALAAGIDFRYVNGLEPSKPGIRMFETLGGGVAVLDYDQDSWPDLYFAQGREYPPHPGQTDHKDRLFRNLGNGRFADVTQFAGLGDANFTHSATVGDYNSDGWPDLYLANLGGNRLYRNNGDGTFTDISADAGLSTTMWTAACVMADFNGDGHPDIYDVNYLRGKQPLFQMCEIDGRIRSCDPAFFHAQQDQLLLNRANGRMQNVTKTSGVEIPGGKGLGVVAADIDGSGRLSLFVANDGVPNFLLLNQSRRPEPPGVKLFRETAMSLGVAYDREGSAEACMGIAFDDADGDGRFDLFVTNFHNQSNTLYRQISNSLYKDDTRQAGLRAPSFRMTGWGTQFLDADLDGWPDLVITNGHVDDFSYLGTPFRMRPQFLRNIGSGRFQELSAKSLGPYFQRKLLGRGLAKLDFNRDGKEDCVISHLYDPIAVLSNITDTKHHWFALKLRGTTSNRDAIGTVATFTLGKRTISRQLIAGDGYSASNERQLLVGLAGHAKVDTLKVRWPSGDVQVFHDVDADQTMLLVEGRPSLTRIPRE